MFTIKKAKNKKFYWDLIAKNGEILASSQEYSSLAMCKKGIASAKKVAVKAKVVVE